VITREGYERTWAALHACNAIGCKRAEESHGL
jgi:hypothetical protein